MASHIPNVCRSLQGIFSGRGVHVGEGTEGANVPALWELMILWKQQSPKKQSEAVVKEGTWETQASSAYRSSGKSFAPSEPQFPLCDRRFVHCDSLLALRS